MCLNIQITKSLLGLPRVMVLDGSLPDSMGGQRQKIALSLGFFFLIFLHMLMVLGCALEILMRCCVRRRSSWPVSSRQLDAFREALELCQLADLGFIGYPYTWNNRRLGAANTRERLDRAVANEAWKLKFPEATVMHIISHASDHLPLILQNHVAPRRQARKESGFKFEEAWLLWDDCTKVV